MFCVNYWLSSTEDLSIIYTYIYIYIYISLSVCLLDKIRLTCHILCIYKSGHLVGNIWSEHCTSTNSIVVSLHASKNILLTTQISFSLQKQLTGQLKQVHFHLSVCQIQNIPWFPRCFCSHLNASMNKMCFSLFQISPPAGITVDTTSAVALVTSTVIIMATVALTMTVSSY